MRNEFFHHENKVKEMAHGASYNSTLNNRQAVISAEPEAIGRGSRRQERCKRLHLPTIARILTKRRVSRKGAGAELKIKERTTRQQDKNIIGQAFSSDLPETGPDQISQERRCNRSGISILIVLYASILMRGSKKWSEDSPEPSST